ncbi:hypothetical protein CDD83_4520 [Cordyceps sp. RAO-2017]|nr:hypothetical protein CDD83_4520 [Cordyceps sp. RAO-2017]
MAPLCADPRQVVIALPPAERLALLDLVQDIIAYIIFEIETPAHELGPVSLDADAEEPDGGPGADGRREEKQRPAEPELSGKAAQEAELIQKAAVEDLQKWRDEFLPRLREIVNVKDNDKIRAERRARRERLDKERGDKAEDGKDREGLGDVQVDSAEDVALLQALYHPIPTDLAAAAPEDRREAVSCVLLLLLATGKYSAHSRALILYLASALELPQMFVNREEAEIAKSLMESSTADQDQKQTMSAEAEAAKRRQENKLSRFWKVGLA